MQVLRLFGLNVRRIRRLQKLSQNELAQTAKISRIYLSGIERGLRNPSLVTVVDLARALRVNVGELLRVSRRRPSSPR